MVVKCLTPTRDRIYDPACGTGGFIVMAFNYVSENFAKSTKPIGKPQQTNRSRRKALFDEIHQSGYNIFGTDFNSNLVKAAQMNMIMNNDGRVWFVC